MTLVLQSIREGKVQVTNILFSEVALLFLFLLSDKIIFFYEPVCMHLQIHAISFYKWPIKQLAGDIIV